MGGRNGQEVMGMGLVVGSSREDTICLLFGRLSDIFRLVESRSRSQLSLCKL